MKDLITRLEKEVGLTPEQANKAIKCFRDYLVETENDPDMKEMMKVKAAHLAKTAKSKYDDLTDKAEDVVEKVGSKVTDYAGKAGDYADELLDKAKKKIKDAADKVSDYMDDSK